MGRAMEATHADYSSDENPKLDYSDYLHELAYGTLAESVAKRHSLCSLPGECSMEHMQEIYSADAWDECRFHWRPFVLTYVYETLPALISQFLVWAIEGKHSMANRALHYPTALFSDVLFRSPLWFLLFCVVHQVYHPDGQFLADHLTDITVVLVLFSFRSMSIAMKYAYLPASDIRLLQNSDAWTTLNYSSRVLGMATHFNIAHTFEIDLMKELMCAALRADVLEHLRIQKFQLDPYNAAKIWATVKESLARAHDQAHLEAGSTLEGESLSGIKELMASTSKFGNVREHIGLGDEAAIATEVASGKLRSSIVAFYFASREYKPWHKAYQALAPFVALILASIRPILRFYFEDTSADTWEIKVFWILCWVATFFSTLTFVLYLFFCILDALKRSRLCQAVLSSIGHQRVRGERLVDDMDDINLPLNTIDDMLAFWALQRVLGPELYRNQSTRYSCAYMLTALLHILVLSGAFLLQENKLVAFSVSVQVLAIVLVGVFNLIASAIMARGTNDSISMTQQVLHRAALDRVLKGRETEGNAGRFTEVSALLIESFEDMIPVQILYMTANLELVSFMLVGLAYLSHTVFKQLLTALHADVMLELLSQ